MGKTYSESQFYTEDALEEQPVVSNISRSIGTAGNVDDAILFAREPKLIEQGYRDGRSSE